MNTLTSQNGFEDVELTELSSRRTTLRRLAAMGLVVAGGTVIAPLATEAQDKKGKQGRRRAADRPGQKRGQKRGPRGGRMEAQLNLPDLPDPVVRASFSIGTRTSLDTYPLMVSGSISFDSELVDLMRRGRQFGLTCEVWYLEDNALRARVGYLPLISGTGLFTATSGRSFTFRAYVPRSKLNEDTRSCFLGFCRGNNEDDITTLLRLSTRRTSSSPWRTATLANGRSYYQTNVIERAL